MSDVFSGQVRFHESLEPLLTDIDKIRPHEGNANNGDVDAIVASINRFGFLAPIIADRDSGRILAGNHRYHALLELGSSVAPVVWADGLDDVEAIGYLLADNRIAALAVTDNAQLLDLLRLLEQHSTIEATGYNKQDMAFLEALEKSRLEQADFSSWPTLSLRVPPHLKNAFYQMTEHATADHERLEALLRLAGWEHDDE